MNRQTKYVPVKHISVMCSSRPGRFCQASGRDDGWIHRWRILLSGLRPAQAMQIMSILLSRAHGLSTPFGRGPVRPRQKAAMQVRLCQASGRDDAWIHRWTILLSALFRITLLSKCSWHRVVQLLSRVVIRMFQKGGPPNIMAGGRKEAEEAMHVHVKVIGGHGHWRTQEMASTMDCAGLCAVPPAQTGSVLRARGDTDKLQGGGKRQ